MAVSPKILYLEADEEITSVVDKLRKTEFKKVVLVIPKEASLLQSVVNLKLLKRQAETTDKSIAIVTHDKVGRALAEKLGILASTKLDDVVNEDSFVTTPIDTVEEETTPTRNDSPLAETEEVIYKKKPKTADDEPSPLVVREAESEPVEPKEEFTKSVIPTEENTDNLMPKLPKKKLAIVISLVLVGLLGLAYIFVPRARANVLVRAERKPVSINFTGEKDAKIDTEKGIIPVEKIEITKETTKKFAATGKRDDGTKASGEVRIYWNAVSGSKGWVAGTRIVPTKNPSLIFVTKSAVTIEAGKAIPVQVVAEKPGDQYNGFLGESFYALNDSAPIVTCISEMNGGSSKEVTIVTQGDFNSAKSSLSKDASEEAKKEFDDKAKEFAIIEETKKEEVVSADSTPAVNGEGSDFNLTIKVQITAIGYKSDDLSQLIKAEVERQLGFSKEVVDDGAKEAKIKIEDVDKEKVTVQGSITTDAYVSSKINPDEIKAELVGLNAIKAENYLKGIEGIEETKFEFFPSFLKIFPRIKSNINLNIEVANKENL